MHAKVENKGHFKSFKHSVQICPSARTMRVSACGTHLAYEADNSDITFSIGLLIVSFSLSDAEVAHWEYKEPYISQRAKYIRVFDVKC